MKAIQDNMGKLYMLLEECRKKAATIIRLYNKVGLFATWELVAKAELANPDEIAAKIEAIEGVLPGSGVRIAGAVICELYAKRRALRQKFPILFNRVCEILRKDGNVPVLEIAGTHGWN